MTGTTGDLGVGLISVGWMGKLHSRAYQAVPYVYPETGIRPRLVHAEPGRLPLIGRRVVGHAASIRQRA